MLVTMMREQLRGGGAGVSGLKQRSVRPNKRAYALRGDMGEPAGDVLVADGIVDGGCGLRFGFSVGGVVHGAVPFAGGWLVRAAGHGCGGVGKGFLEGARRIDVQAPISNVRKRGAPCPIIRNAASSQAVR